MKKLFLIALLALTPSIALPQTRPLPEGRVDNGVVSFGSVLPSFAKRDANKTILMPDALQILGSGSTGDISGMTVGGATIGTSIQGLNTALAAKAPLANPTFTGNLSTSTLQITGPGSTGDISGMVVTPNASATAGTLSRLIADRAPLTNPAFIGTASASAVDVLNRFIIRNAGNAQGIIEAGNGSAYFSKIDPVSGQLGGSVTVTTDGVNIAGYLNNYNGGTFQNPMTYGGNATGAGQVFATNGLIYGIPNYFTAPIDPATGQPGKSNLSTYASRDHAGATRSMRAPISRRVPDANTTYTATTITNPNLIIDANVKIGMVVDTQHVPLRYSGAVTAIDLANKTLTVNGWFRVDGTGLTGTPPNGIGAIVNPASKLWISNDILALGRVRNPAVPQDISDDHDIAGAGTELNINVLSNRVVEAYGFDAVIFGVHSPQDAYAFPARGGGAARWRAAVYGVDNKGGIRSFLTAANLESFLTPLLETKIGPDEVFNMNHSGRMSALRLQSIATAADITLDRFAGAKVIKTGTAVVTITLPSPADVNDGREIDIINLGGAGNVTVNTHLGVAFPNGIAPNFSQRFYAFQNSWFPISKTPVN